MDQPLLPVELVAHATPNPDAYKFLCSLELLPEGRLEFTRDSLPAGYPVLEAAFSAPEIVRVYAAGHFLTLVKQPEADWNSLTVPLRSALLQALRHLQGPPLPHVDQVPGDTQPLAEWFRTRILPATEQDGGAIEFDRLAEGVLHVRTAGACTGCPYLPITLERGILQPLQPQHPELRRIQAG